MIPYPYNMVDMGGIDLAEANGTVVDGLYAKIVEAVNACGDVVLYNWKFAGIEISPQHTSILMGDPIIISGAVQVTAQDEVTVPGINPIITPLSVAQNGIFNPPSGVAGYAPVTVDVPPPSIIPLNVTQNGVFNPPSGVDGYAPVTVEIEGGGEQFYPYSLFLSENLTDQGWVDPDSGRSITLNSGSWVVSDNKLVANGAYYTFDVPDSDCLVQCSLTLGPNFTPRAQSDWWSQSTLFGRELPSYQNDLSATVVEYNGALYPSIGAERSGYTRGTIPITKGVEYTISLAHIGTKYFLYVDGVLSVSLQYAASGTRISNMGLFWNKDSAATAVVGTISKLGVWTLVPTTAPDLPDF